MLNLIAEWSRVVTLLSRFCMKVGSSLREQKQPWLPDHLLKQKTAPISTMTLGDSMPDLVTVVFG